MSYLFRGHKKYFDFIESLEKEEQEFRRLNQEYSFKSEMCNKDYKLKAQNVTQTIRRMSAREIRHTNPSMYKSSPTKKSRTVKLENNNNNIKNRSSITEGSFLSTSPARLVSSQWPVRPNSAFRILAPVSKLRKYSEMNEDIYKKVKDPPLIHSTGIQKAKLSVNLDAKNNNSIFTHTQTSQTFENELPIPSDCE